MERSRSIHRGSWLFAAVAAVVLAVPVPAGRGDGAETITARELRRHVSYLADDARLGREAGRDPIRRTEAYIARSFRRAGLAPLPGRDDHFLDVRLYREGYDLGATTIELEVGGKTVVGVPGEDFRPFDFSDAGSVEGPVVFAGYGITAEDPAWDDYAGLDVTGKIVFVLRHEPGERDPTSSFGGVASSRHARFTTKAENAAAHGARGMILITDPLNHDAGDDLRLGGRLRLDAPASAEREASSDPPFLAVHAGRDLAVRLAAASGLSLDDLQRSVDAGRPAAELDLGAVRARIAVQPLEHAEPVAARNVAAFLPGRDPVLRDEWIVVGGHHDHVGGFDGPGDTVFNGADDNASGTAGVLELAQAFAARPEAARRSLVFVTFTAEEKGLLGSRALFEQELLPTERVAFMLNLDMIGRNPGRPVDVFGDGYARGVREIVESLNADDLALRFGGGEYSGNSDHDPFYLHDVPFVFFFTGVHADYHQLGDHPDKLDYARMQRIVRLAYGLVDHLAEGDAMPGFIHNLEWLGARVEVLAAAGAPQAELTAVDAGSRGALAGLAQGDVLVAFDGERLDDPRSVGRRFRAIDPGSTVVLTVRRTTGEHKLSVERARTGYLGVVPSSVGSEARARFGLADDEGVLLRQVADEGPAAAGGLEGGDILIRIAGRPIGMRDLRTRLMQLGAGETVALTVIRDGERLARSVTLGERPQP